MAKIFNVEEYQDPDIQSKAIEGWSRVMEMLELYLNDGNSFLMGDQFTIADIPAGLVVNRWFSIDFAKRDFPAIKDYYERLSERPAYLAHGRNGLP